MEKKENSTSSLNLEGGLKRKHKVTTKETVLFGFGPLADQMSHQMFQFLVFTYYYAVAGIDVDVLAWAFVIFAIWDSINDPLLGPLSDRTKSKLGKRRVWVLISIIPFGLSNVFLFTVGSGWTSQWKTAYMIIIIIIYDTFYTIFDTNNLALFGEMFETPEERGKGNMWKNIMTIVGVIIGFVLPTIFISDLAPPTGATGSQIAKIVSDYNVTGIIVGVLTIVFGFLFFKFGMIEEPSTDNADMDNQVGILTMVKQTFSNFTFIIFCFANLIKWFVFKLLTTLVPLYATHVLGISGIAVSILLLSAFLSAMAFFPVMKNLGLRIGWRNGFIVTQVLWCFALIPFWFFGTESVVWAYVTMVFVGIGLAGAIYFVEPIMADLIDEDEVRYKVRRSGSYYGINGLINRYSTILVFAVIALVLKGYGWGSYLVGEEANISNLVIGLKLLMTPISIAGNIVVIILLLLYPLHGQRLKEMQDGLYELRLSREK